MNMKVELTDDMIESPGAYKQEWEQLLTAAPKVAARFHDSIAQSSAKKTEAYYRELAQYASDHRYTPPHGDANLVVALMDLGVRADQEWYHGKLAASIVPPASSKEIDLPVSAATLDSILCNVRGKCTPYIHAFEPQSEDELYDLLVRSQNSYWTQAATNSVRTKMRKSFQLIEDPLRFLKLGIGWCNEAVFSKIELGDRKLLAKECMLAGMDPVSVPLMVYARTRGGAKTPWIIQSDEWTDEEKADCLNKRLVRVVNPSLVRTCFSDFSRAGRRRDPGDSFSVSDYYGPLLFPQPIVVDLKGRLNNTGERSLISYLYAAPMKVKARVSARERDRLIALVEDWTVKWAAEEAEKVIERLDKHLKV